MRPPFSLHGALSAAADETRGSPACVELSARMSADPSACSGLRSRRRKHRFRPGQVICEIHFNARILADIDRTKPQSGCNGKLQAFFEVISISALPKRTL